MTPLSLDAVTLTAGFWAERQELNRSAILAHAHTWMGKLGWVANFANAASGSRYEHKGMQFADSEVYKLIEALSWSLHDHDDPDLRDALDTLIGAVEAAQDPDGYLHTLFGREWQAPRYSDLKWGHELYCFGHLMQAAVAHYRATGSSRLLTVAKRLADHVCVMFGADGWNKVCGHPEIEVALVELYRATGDDKYLEQARVFLDRRGTGTLPAIEFGREYWQDARPIRETEAFHGHAVRALYLAAGAVDAAVETGDDELLATIERQWERTVARRTYITGGMGSHHMDEAFGDDFVLPPDRSYCETCAGVASIMVSWRLLLATGRARYADLIERTLYNVVATSPSADGTAFFYANTLHQRSAAGEAPKTEEGVTIRGGATGRQEWFEVSCCPPNVARTLGSLSGYVATTDNAGVQIHQYASGRISAEIDGGAIELDIATDYPARGDIRITVTAAPDSGATVAVRIPAWADGASASSDGGSVPAVPGTYARVPVTSGSVVLISLPLATRVSRPDARIDAVRGTLAFERGPEVLALESIDLPANWDLDHVEATGKVDDLDDSPVAEFITVTETDSEWPYRAERTTSEAGRAFIPLVRYHEWAERGPSTMRIFVPEARDS